MANNIQTSRMRAYFRQRMYFVNTQQSDLREHHFDIKNKHNKCIFKPSERHLCYGKLLLQFRDGLPIHIKQHLYLYIED